MTLRSDVQIDVRGQCCPMPLVRLAMAFKGLGPSQVVEITGDDPIFETSVRDFCRVNGHTVLETSAKATPVVTLWLRARGASR